MPEIGMTEQSDEQRQEFETTAIDIITKASEQGLVLRLLGSLAFQIHCPKFGYLQKQLGRAYTDIDYAGYNHHASQMGKFFTSIGFNEDVEVNLFYAGQRMIFNHSNSDLHVDVFFDQLDFCHKIKWIGRLEIDPITLPLAEMLLEKMQIVKINEKDIIDTIMLLLEHPLGNHDDETINISLISRFCAQDWGLWRTITMNLTKVGQMANNYPQLSQLEKSKVEDQVKYALEVINHEPKTGKWKLRSMVGDRVKWYKSVEDS
jgi:hypothetical protein